MPTVLRGTPVPSAPLHWGATVLGPVAFATPVRRCVRHHVNLGLVRACSPMFQPLPLLVRQLMGRWDLNLLHWLAVEPVIALCHRAVG